MLLELDKGFSFSSWKGEFYAESGQKIASIDYSEGGENACLNIVGSGATFAMLSTSDTFHGSSSGWGGGAKMLYNGEHVYTFTSKNPYEIEVKTAKIRGARTIVKTKIDSWKRRFCWAYRQGLSWYKAWQYASWGNILMGDKYCFCSLYNIGSGRRLFNMSRHPVFNSCDEQVWLTLKDVEKMLILALSVRHLCGVYVGKTQTPLSSVFSKNCPDIPSFVVNDKDNCVINPHYFHRRPFGEFLFTGNAMTWLIVASFWILYCLMPNSGTFGIAIMFSIIGFFWILICKWGNNFSPLEW